MESTRINPGDGKCPSCGERQPEGHDDDMRGWHQSGCEQVTKHMLARAVADICAEVDRLYGNAPGTAALGVFAYYWPPGPTTGLDVLHRLYDDAHGLLDDARDGVPLELAIAEQLWELPGVVETETVPV